MQLLALITDLTCLSLFCTSKNCITSNSTYSDYIAIEETTRMKFFDEIREAINDNSGIITLCDTIDLQLARKP